jgi:hypothetical protein
MTFFAKSDEIFLHKLDGVQPCAFSVKRLFAWAKSCKASKVSLAVCLLWSFSLQQFFVRINGCASASIYVLSIIFLSKNAYE